ncbi:MAG: glycine cleavage system protein H [Dethiosulfovibrio peptidovorans]|nr:MAG: glycine cleavage system protein H [Dethiosulfovibrio peptidovorans]
MAEIKDGLRYTKEHEWIKVEGGKGRVGISDYAQHAMGDIVFVELPEVGQDVSAGGDLCVVESVKGANDVYSPASGKVVEINEALDDSPEAINEDPYGSWIAVVELSNASEVDALMDPAAYKAFCDSQD